MTLNNLDSTPVHMFSPGETFPCCQLNAGGARSVTVRYEVGASTGIQFSAGRNGVIGATTTCRPLNGGAFPSTASVNYTSSGALGCIGW